jgi:hypothetical protein
MRCGNFFTSSRTGTSPVCIDLSKTKSLYIVFNIGRGIRTIPHPKALPTEKLDQGRVDDVQWWDHTEILLEMRRLGDAACPPVPIIYFVVVVD